MRISEVASSSGVPVTTLRYYESIGLLAPRRGANGYRVYDEAALERLSFIDAAKQLDLSLPDIAELVRVVDEETCTRARAALQPKLGERLREVDERIASLQRLHARLAAAEAAVAACPDDARPCRTQCALSVGGRGGCAPVAAGV